MVRSLRIMAIMAASAGLSRASVSAGSQALHDMVDRIPRIAELDVPVLIRGDPDTGKRLVARAIHALGPRREGPLVIVSGAVLREAGQDAGECLREALGGSLVLEGPEELSPRAQVHLLRALGAPGVEARYGPGSQPLGARLITLTHACPALGDASAELLGALHYRLSGVRIDVPALPPRGPDRYALLARLIDELDVSER